MMKNNKPVIRFKGFSEEWEEKELGEIATMKARIGWQGLTQKEFLDSGDYYLITGTDFNNGSIDIKNCHYIGADRYNQDSNIQVKDNDVLITKDGTIGKVAFVKNLDKPATLNAGVFVVRGKNENISNLYLYHHLASPLLLDFADKQATGGTIKHLNQNVLVRFPVPLPQIEEQTQIGNFFKNLDNLITLHQRKYDKLGILKKAMLEKMFPKNGANVPEIRFKGFSEAWEEKTLGVIGEIKTGPFGSTLHAEDYIEDGEPIVTTEHFKSGILPNNKKGIPQVSNFDYYRLKSYLLKSGDIVFSRVGSVDINAHVKDYQDGWLFSGRVLRVRATQTIDSEFLHQELSTTRVRNNVIMRAVGQTMPSINTEILKITPIKIPSDIDEQIQIGTYFKNLDDLLRLHEKELEKLKNLKKALLEKMFV